MYFQEEDNKLKSIALTLLLTLSIFICSPVLAADSDYYRTDNVYKNPHLNLEALRLPDAEFLALIKRVEKDPALDRKALFLQVPDELYSGSISKLQSAGFFLYHSFPEENSTVWCKTNGSGAPLAFTHTYGSRAVTYYEKTGEYYFLLIKDRFGPQAMQFPGGYVQPTDEAIAAAFESRQSTEIKYRAPQEVAINEVLEETGFDLKKYGYGLTRQSVTIAQMYAENTRPERGIHSPNDHCTFLAFRVEPNTDSLTPQVHEIESVSWVKATDILTDKIEGEYNKATPLTKEIVKRIVDSENYMEKLYTQGVSKEELIKLARELGQRNYIYKRGTKEVNITLHNILFSSYLK